MSGALVLVILGLMVVASIVVIVVTRRDEARREKRRQRFEITDTGQRLPLAAERPPASPPKPVEEIAAFVATEPLREPDEELARTRAERSVAEEEPSTSPVGRFVHTPDGESLLTTPPFKRRDAIFSRRHGKYALSLIRRLPPWLSVCPKVRLDTLVSPTTPDGRDPEDWREWRRRVRVRSVDLLLVDQRTWEPLLAILLERDHPAAASTVGAGRDHIVDEVLTAVGIPMIRATGSLRDDWPAIRPYVEQAMLPTTEDADREPSALAGGNAWDASAVVKLLRMDDDRGGLLE